ncbi:MAG: tetratricopeptide repeat protein [Myxococcota bacterium]
MLRLALATFFAAATALPGLAAAQDLAQLEAAARADRRDADAQVAYGHALLRAARYRDAYRVLHDAARLRGNTLEAHFDAARAAFAEGDYRRSRAACQQLERRGRQETLTKVCRARAFLVWNRAGRAFEELEAALAQDPNAFEVQLALGDAHRLRASTSESEAAYQAAIRLDGSRYEAQFGLGLLYANARREADALRAFEAAYRLEPNDPALLFELGTRKEGAEAQRLLTRAVGFRPDMVRAHEALGDLALAANEDAAATASYEAALAASDESAPAHYGLGVVDYRAGRIEEARTKLERAIELVPNFLEAVLLLGQIQEQTGQTDEAYESYRLASNIDLQNPAGRLHGARLAISEGRATKAIGLLDPVIQRQPNLGAALALYGDAWRIRRNREEAIRYYERALSQGTGDFDRQATQRSLDEVRNQTGPRRLQRATVR